MNSTGVSVRQNTSTTATSSSFHYLLIGDGRVASHLNCYFASIPLPFHTWCRRQSLRELDRLIHSSSHIMLLIRDDAIESFIKQHLMHTNALLLHCSGSLVSDYAYGVHPLFSFNQGLYTPATYQAIPFVVEHDAPAFDRLLPGLANPHVCIHKSHKAKYHALCALSGNLSCLMWQTLFSTLQQEFHLPPAVAHAWLRQQTENLINHPDSALTGPLVRDDRVTIKKHLAALSDSPFQDLYQSFIDFYHQTRGKMHEIT